jgi:soluble lytic murein transglycosylase
MLGRFGALLDASDHGERLRTLLMGPQGPSTLALLPLVSEDERRMAYAVMALRQNAGDAMAKVSAVPYALADEPVLAYERARFYRRKNLETLGFSLLDKFPRAIKDDDSQNTMWLERRNYFNAAIRAGNAHAAYNAMANNGFTSGEKLVEAEFFAGWTALKKLNDPQLADRHFATLQAASSTPITQGRAFYWRGRAAEARNDQAAADAFYKAGARYTTSFYGQLCADKAGVKTITLPRDPNPTAADRQRFDGREPVRAARMLADLGEKDLFRTFVLAIDDTLPTAEEFALLIDVARSYGDQDLAMRVARAAAQKNFILAERGYPTVTIPQEPGSAETAFALSIARQESNFLPTARSSVGARGMMQLMPATARVVAGRLGTPYDESRLWNAEYNLRLGAYHLGELVNQFSGSYVMAAAGYNAGPGRPPKWVSECGDPRGGSTDPLDFVECIPFAETRNYVMRTLETTQIYRARLNGGTAPLTLASDLRRGSYGYVAPIGAGPNGGPIPYESSVSVTRPADNATP